jgi:hypothetical protein
MAKKNEKSKPDSKEETGSTTTETTDVVIEQESLDSSREERMKKLAGEEKEFPVTNLTLAEASRLGMTFIRENLVDGQIFSINPTQFMFLDMPELGISLNSENYKWEYKEDSVMEDAIPRLIHAVNNGALILGDTLMKAVEKKWSGHTVNADEYLVLPFNQLRDKLVDLMARPNKTDEDGYTYSPLIDIKYLIQEERNSKNRAKYIRMLENAHQRTPGSPEFVIDDNEYERAEAQYEERKKNQMSVQGAVKATGAEDVPPDSNFTV